MRFRRASGSIVIPLLVLAGCLTLCAGCVTNYDTRMLTLDEMRQATGLASSDEERVAAVLSDVHRGMQNKQIYKVLAHVSKNYFDSEGRDYKAIETGLVELFKRYREIKITRVTPRILVQGDYARAIETFGTSAEPYDPTVEPPINLQGQLTVSLEKVGGRWLIVEWGSML